jgi:DNA-binding PadR family transcriptional regulator
MTEHETNKIRHMVLNEAYWNEGTTKSQLDRLYGVTPVGLSAAIEYLCEGNYLIEKDIEDRIRAETRRDTKYLITENGSRFIGVTTLEKLDNELRCCNVPGYNDSESEVVYMLYHRPMFAKELELFGHIPQSTVYRALKPLSKDGAIFSRKVTGAVPWMEIVGDRLKHNVYRLNSYQLDIVKRVGRGGTRRGGPKPSIRVLTPEYRKIMENQKENLRLIKKAKEEKENPSSVARRRLLSQS